MELGLKDEDMKDLGDGKRFGFEVNNDYEEQQRAIADAQLRFAMTDTKLVEGYAILLVLKNPNDPNELTARVEFAGTADSKDRMFTSFVRALHQDSLVREELRGAENKEKQNDQ